MSREWPEALVLQLENDPEKLLQMDVIIQLREPALVISTKVFGPAEKPLAGLLGGKPSNKASYSKITESLNKLILAHEQLKKKLIEQVPKIEFKPKRDFYFTFNGLAAKISQEDLKKIQAMPEVKEVYPDLEVEVLLEESVPLINADDVWREYGVQGQGRVVAILDTGIDYTHPDLGGCFGERCKVFGGYDFAYEDADPLDIHGHGTHVAGIVAANGIKTGVAPEAKLLAYKVLDDSGSGTASDVIAGLEAALNPDGDPLTDDAAEVINLSLGARGGHPDDPLAQAVDGAVDAGVVVVVAAGNSGPHGQTIDTPGTARNALTVGASDKSDKLADFSSRGPTFGYPPLMPGIKPDLLAPGQFIRSTIPGGYKSMSGTSMATPHVAGAAALLKQIHPSWTPFEIKSALMTRAVNLGYSVNEQGSGRLDIYRSAGIKSLITPPSLSLGIVDLAEPTWQKTTSIEVENLTYSTLTYTLALNLPTELPAGISINFPASITLNPTSTVSFDFTVSVDTAIAPDNPYEGVLVLTSESEELRIPFFFIKKGLTVQVVPPVSSGETLIKVESLIWLPAAPAVSVTQPDGTLVSVSMHGAETKWQGSFTVKQERVHRVTASSLDYEGKTNYGQASFRGDLTPPGLTVSTEPNYGQVYITVNATEDIQGQWHWKEELVSKDDEKTSLNPAIGADSRSTIHLVWEDTADRVFSIRYRKSQSYQWGETIIISDPTKYARQPELLVDKEDKLHIFYWQNNCAHRSCETYWLHYQVRDALSGSLILGPIRYEDVSTHWRYLMMRSYDYAQDSQDNIHGIGTYYLKIAPDGQLLTKYPLSGQSIALTSDNTPHIVETHNSRCPCCEGNVTSLWHTWYDSARESWLTEKFILDEARAIYAARIAVDENDNLNVTVGLDNRIAYKMRKGLEWIDKPPLSFEERPLPFCSLSGYSLAAMEADKDNLHITYQVKIDNTDPNAFALKYAKFNLQSQAWSEEEKPLNEARNYIRNRSRLTIDPAGNVYAIWEGWKRLGTFFKQPELFYRRYQNSPVVKITLPDSSVQRVQMFGLETEFDFRGSFRTVLVGPHLLQAEGYDSAGNKGETSTNFDIDIVPPDLKLNYLDISFEPVSPVMDSTSTIKALIHNLGSIEATARLTFYEGAPEPERIIGTPQSIRLPAYQAEQFQTNWRPQEEDSPGNLTRKIWVVVDEVSPRDYDDSNNSAFNTVKLLPNLPDLSLEKGDISFYPAKPSVGDEVLITANVHNIGFKEASKVLVQFSYVYYGESVPKLIGTKEIGLIAADSQEIVQIDWETKGEREGAYAIRVTIDPEDRIKEVREDNNFAIGVLTLQPSRGLPLSGQVQLFGRTDHRALFTFELRNPGTTRPLETHSVWTERDGRFSFETSLPTGRYDITAKEWHYLRGIARNVNITPSGAAGITFQHEIPGLPEDGFLRGGDANNDNLVNLNDFSMLRSFYGRFCPPPAKIPPPYPPAHCWHADFNNDTRINITDFSILAATFS